VADDPAGDMRRDRMPATFTQPQSGIASRHRRSPAASLCAAR
jgi:hypothetical protein